MSLIKRVAILVWERGPSSADDLFKLLADDGFTRPQVNDALWNAARCGWLQRGAEARRQSGSGGRPAMKYEPGPVKLPRVDLKTSVSEAVIERGRGTLEEIWGVFPDCTRQQVQNALLAAARDGLLSVLVKGAAGRFGKGTRQAVFGPPRPPEEKSIYMRPKSLVTTVFALGDRADVPKVWPPATGSARVYRNLEPWEA